MINVIIIDNVIKILEEIMKLFTKVMAAALLSTALSTASMAAVDLSREDVLANDAKPEVTRGVLKIVKAPTGLVCEVTFDANLVDSFATLDTARFSKVQSKNLLDGMKSLYAELATAASDKEKLKAKLGASPVKATLTLDPSKAAADYKNEVNHLALAALMEAVVDDPFKAVEASAADLLSLDGKISARRRTNNPTYATVQDMIDAFKAARTEASTGDKKAAAGKGQAILDAAKAAGFGAKERRDLGYLVAKEARKDFAVADVREAKTKAVGKVPTHTATAAEETALDAYGRFLVAVDSGAFSLLGFDDSDALRADKGAAEAFVQKLVESMEAQVVLTNQKSVLEQQLAAAQAKLSAAGPAAAAGGHTDLSTDPALQTQGGSKPAFHAISPEHQGWVTGGIATYDPASGELRYTSNNSLAHQY